MAISTVKIGDTVEWAKRLMFNRNPVIGNSLEPALTAANMVMQTILSPPFSWWWNNEDLVFTCDPAFKTSTLSNVQLTANVITFTGANSFFAEQEIIISGLTDGAVTFLNGQILKVATATGTNFTASFTHANVGSTPVSVGVATAATTQDYSIAAPEFSHIDWAAVQDPSQTPAKWYEMKTENVLSLDTIRARPQFINPQSQDANGNVIFRVMPAPDKAYPVVINTMKTAPLLTSINQTWAPIPDYMQYIFNWGFLALMWSFADDPRFAQANAKFTAGILARAQGLTEQERNIFLNNWDELTGKQQMKASQGMQARSV